tara:strand:+ start:754 stop:1458 length:705 start_codon:yes stop_codon:yes gene_type:complete
MAIPKIHTRDSCFAVDDYHQGKDNNQLPISLDVVIVGANPKLSKSWYKYEWSPERDTNLPDCYSFDGTKPSEYSNDPQNDICATCTQNAWGSKISPTGGKIKACSDQKRLAVTLADATDGTIYLLQVTPTSLKNLNLYQKDLLVRGIPPEIIRTKLSFDKESNYPKLKFNFVGFNPTSAQANVDKLLGSNEVKIVTGELVVQDGHTQSTSASSYGFTEEVGFTLTQYEQGGSHE